MLPRRPPVFARRLGTKIVVPAGLILMGVGFLIASTLGSNTAYFGPVLASMVLMAVGLGLVTAPSTGAILAVLPLGKAGVGSAVDDVTRELGGTRGDWPPPEEVLDAGGPRVGSRGPSVHGDQGWMRRIWPCPAPKPKPWLET